MRLRRKHVRLTVAVGLLGVSLAGCGPGGVAPLADADTGTTADAGFEVLPPEIDWLEAGVPPIAPPSPPSLTPCPEGWREVGGQEGDEEGAPITCAPYAEDGPAECADGWAHFLGEPGCTPVGASCPVGDFPEGLPSDQPVLYVLAGASAGGEGGDGSEGAPLGRIAEAMALASPGTVIALGKGVYDEVVYLSAGVTLWGACAAETRLTVSSPSLSVQGVVQVLGADTRLQNVRIGPADVSGVVVGGARAEVTLEGVLIEGTRSAGLVVIDGGRLDGRTLSVSDTRAQSDGYSGVGLLALTESSAALTRVLLSRNRTLGVSVEDVGTSVTLTDLVVRDTQSRESDGRLGGGLAAREGATVEVTHALFERNRAVGVLVDGVSTSVTLTDLIVRDTQSEQSNGVVGRGLNVQGGAAAAVTRGLFARNRDVGVLVAGVGTTVTLADLVVRDMQSRQSDGGGGRGLVVQSGATAELSRGFFARNRDVCIVVDGVGTSMTLTDIVVRDTESQMSDGVFGRGLNVQGGAAAEVTRMLLERNRDAGLFVDGAGTSATLTDIVVRDTQSQQSDGVGGRGLALQSGATAEVTRALIERNRDVGVVVDSVGTSVTLMDIVVRDTQSQQRDGTSGRGLSVQFSATAEVTRALFERNRDVGVFAAGVDTSVTLAGLVVRDTQDQESDGVGGRGLSVQDGAAADVAGALFARNRDIAVLAVGGAAQVRLTDFVVEETAEQRCAATTCPDRPYGVGLASISSAAIAATRFRVANSALCGVFLADNGAVDLSAGQVSGAPVGVCLQVDGYAVTRLTEGVRYIENGSNLDATSLLLPELSEPLEPTR